MKITQIDGFETAIKLLNEGKYVCVVSFTITAPEKYGNAFNRKKTCSCRMKYLGDVKTLDLFNNPKQAYVLIEETPEQDFVDAYFMDKVETARNGGAVNG